MKVDVPFQIMSCRLIVILYVSSAFSSAVHVCRIEMIKDHEDKRDWEAWLLSHGMSATCRSVDDMHYKEIEEKPGSGKKKK